MRVDGRAFDASGLALPANTQIVAAIDGVVYSNVSAVVYDGQGSFAVHVVGNDQVPATPEVKEGADLGETVLFLAGDFTGPTEVFNETAAWSPDSTLVLDLHLGSAATTPAPLKVQGLVTRPAQGGPQYAFVCNPTAAAVDLDDYYLAVNRPGVYEAARIDLTGSLAAGGVVPVDLGASFLIPTGDALKLVYDNPGGAMASAGGRPIVVDRVEYNATAGGTLSWEPGNTILGDAPAPRPGYILERATFCEDTNDPSDFRLSRESGLPANGPPSVALVDPAPGVVLRSNQPFTIRWTMDDDVFLTEYLLVWVNVTVAGTSEVLLAAAEGATSVDWIVPDVETSDARITVDVEDPFGEQASASGGPFRITREVPIGTLAIVIAALVVGVILLFLLISHLSRRRKPGPPEAKAAPGTAPSAGPAPAPPAQAAAPPGQKACPRCGTFVYERDWTCFYCGYRFPGPP